MRILALSHLYPHEGERRYGIFVARQLQAMAAAGAEITLLVPRPSVPAIFDFVRGRRNKAEVDLIEYPGVEALSLPYLSLPGIWFWRWSGLFAYLAVRKVARKLHAAKPFDIIYSTQLILGGDAGRRLAVDLAIPSANLAIGTDVNVIAKQSPQMKRHYASILRDLDGTLTCGHSLQEEIAKNRPSPPFLETQCVYGVVDLDYFQPAEGGKNKLRAALNLYPDPTTILYVGYLRREKGLIELIEAFSKTHQRQPATQLILCGSGVDEEAIKSAAKQSIASDAIHFVGTIAPSEVRSYMQASDVFVLPSYNEGMPNAVMEAMACGLPVVCTSVGGLSAALSSSRGAKLVPPQQVAPLEAALRSVLDHADLRDEMSRAARETAAQQFDVRKSARRILDYLSSVIANKQSLTSASKQGG